MFRGDETGTGACVLLALLLEVKFWEILEARDQELAREAQAKGCQVCDGKLDVGNYPRKDRGLGASNLPLAGIRLSLCCRVRGCRKRHTPPSVRFLSRRVYLAPIFILACVADIAEASPSAAAEPVPVPAPAALAPEPEEAQEVPPPEVSPATLTPSPPAAEGPTATPAGPGPTRSESSSTASFGASERMVTRWRRWWREEFPGTPVGQELRGRLMPPLDPDESLPGGLLRRYTGTLQERVLRVLELLLPLSATRPRPPPW